MSSPPAPAAAGSPDWTTQAADTIESVVGSIRDKTTVPLETVARALVYGIVIATMAIVAMVVLVIIAIRALTYIPGAKVWMVDSGLGLIFSLIGLWLWRKRRPPVTK